MGEEKINGWRVGLSVFQWAASIVILLLFTGPMILLGLLDSSKRGFGILTRYLCRSILWVNRIKVRIFFKGCFLESKNYLVCANHQSLFDVLVLPAKIPLPLAFVSKSAYFKIPIIGFGMRAGGHLEVTRTNSQHDIQIMHELARALKKGRSFVMFPEGTRSRDGNIGPFKMGAFHAACESGTPILPVTILGSRDRMVPGRKIIFPGTIILIMGSPLAPKGLSAYELRDRVRKTILEQKEAWPKA